VEIPLVPILAELEQEGVGLRREWITRAKRGVEAVCDNYCHYFTGAFGKPINPFSDDEVRVFLWESAGSR
jgi:DNA polymerase I-like protein with 3'-5' exonuclease and polymerase domains